MSNLWLLISPAQVAADSKACAVTLAAFGDISRHMRRTSSLDDLAVPNLYCVMSRSAPRMLAALARVIECRQHAARCERNRREDDQ